jgi:uncharacterized protein YbaR (Trm112 family)/SAM-dependent methyltransferase
MKRTGIGDRENRRTFEKALVYLACPADQQELYLDVPNKDCVEEGSFKCSRCGIEYPILNGIPYFGKTDGFRWSSGLSNSEIAESVADTIDNKELSWLKIISLPELFMKKCNREQSIDSIFEVVSQAILSGGVTNEKAAGLLQAATRARYEIEIYTGTFRIPGQNIEEIERGYGGGLVIEGACATGECLQEVSDVLMPRFSIGLDIAGALVKEAYARNSLRNMLFIQGDISELPIKSESAEIYILNNVFDRVVNPRKAAEEANRIVYKNNGMFVLSNCDPLQYNYRTADGKDVLFVPQENQISLEEGLSLAGFKKSGEVSGRDGTGWKISTVAYGKENLPYKSLVGRR